MEHIIEWIVFIVSTIAAALYMVRMRRKSVDDVRDQAPLTSRQKPFVLALIVLSPLVAGTIFYYGWNKRFPKKAKWANNWSIIVFVILVLLYAALGLK